MPSWKWRSGQLDAIPSFEKRHGSPGAGVLFSWAARAVESLHYLDDLDRQFGEGPRADHDLDLIDVTHARWATTTSITALDLCAAGLGRVFCGNTNPRREFALRYFDSANSHRAEHFRDSIPENVVAWVDAVLRDDRYVEIKQARDWLTHSRLTRHFAIGPVGRRRLRLGLESGEVEVRRLVEDARDVASDHVSAFVDLLSAI